MANELPQLFFATLRLPVKPQGLLKLLVVLAKLLRSRLIISPERQTDVQKNNLDQGKHQGQNLLQVVAKGFGEDRKSKLDILIVSAQIPSRLQADALMGQAHPQAIFKIGIVQRGLQQLGEIVRLYFLERFQLLGVLQ